MCLGIQDQKALSSATLTLLAQEERVEADVVDTEVQPALAGHPAFPAAAGVVGDQLLRLGEVEPGLELHQGFSELLWLLLLLCQPAAGLLSDQSLRHRKRTLTQPASQKLDGRGERTGSGKGRWATAKGDKLTQKMEEPNLVFEILS